MISISSMLKDTTVRAHEHLESLPFSRDLESGKLPIESYVGFLRAMAVVHAVLEHELPVESEPLIDHAWNDGMRKLPALQRDLSFFADQQVMDIPAASDAAVAMANQMLLRNETAPVSMLGYLYVLEGASQGAPTLARWAASAYSLKKHQGLAFLSLYGDQGQERWQEFRGRIESLEIDDQQRDTVVEAAMEAYEGVRRILSALYPFDASTLGHSVTSLNPEAGAHPSAQDPRELEAVDRAARRCVQEFPYFAWRYGERGWRYSLSDGAWLVTLVKYPQERIDRQVAWLNTVLSSRGMPSVLLQRHLELLYEELRLRVSDSEADYLKLLRAADALRDARCVFGTEVQRVSIERDFEAAVGQDWARRLPGSAAILVSAMIDHRRGIEGAMQSVLPWFNDDTVFPAQWRDAVAEAVRAAEALQEGS